MAPCNDNQKTPLIQEPSPPAEKQEQTPPYKPQIVWINVVFIIGLHVMALYGATLLPRIRWATCVWIVTCYILGGAGVTVGAHRLWAHRSYKAKWPFRLIMMILNSMAVQNDILEWSRDHRAHHKYAETDADPHNATRGFFFSHVGWLMQRKHPDVISKGKGIDLSDLYDDEIVMFQRRHYKKMCLLMCVVVPTLVPWMWGESLWYSYFTAFVMRYVFSLNAAWCVNSFAHFWGNRPYDVNINPAESTVANTLTMGEGYHNYHHTFPQDYAASEFGTRINLSTVIIDIGAALGLVYDRKVISKEMILGRMKRTGALKQE